MGMTARAMMKTIFCVSGLALFMAGPAAAAQAKTSAAAQGLAAVNGTHLYYEVRGRGRSSS